MGVEGGAVSTSRATAAIAAEAARLVVETGMEYAAARQKAARSLAAGGRGAPLPGTLEIEEAVREHLSVFHADTQPEELAELRRLAAGWMRRLARFRPHLGGAVWRGTATQASAVRIDLYCDDPKSAPIELLNLGIPHDLDAVDEGGREPVTVLTLAAPSRLLGQPATVHLFVRDADDLRGALKPDETGQTWRGDLAMLEARLANPDALGNSP